MLNFAQMLKAPVQAKPATGQKKSRRGGNANQHAAVRRNAAQRYIDAFAGRDKTTVELADRLDILPQSCLTQLYRLEKRGQVKRVGTRDNGFNHPPIVWRWVGEVGHE